MPRITLDQVHKTFPDGTRALRGVDLHVEPGEGVVLLGHNGSGKSTLLRCITGLERATAGQITIDGIDIRQARHRDLRQVRRGIGMVFQRFNLVGNLSAYQNVLFGALGRRSLWSLNRAMVSAGDRDKAVHCLERVGLSGMIEQRADTLSGGQQQRVAIARMLMQEPELVLADEPIASLDPKAGLEVMELLWSVVRERGLTVICTLHHLELALQYGDRIVGLKQGEKVLDQNRGQLAESDLNWLYDDALPSQAHAPSPSPMASHPQQRI